MKFDTKVVRAGISPAPTTGSILPPIYETATFVLPEVGRDLGFDYTRSSNPTRQVLEDNLAAIDSGEYAVSFASGMSAVDSCFKLLAAGDHIVCGDDVYGGVTRLLDNVTVQQGIDVSYVDTTNADAVRSVITPKTRMLWIETPTNPLHLLFLQPGTHRPMSRKLKMIACSRQWLQAHTSRQPRKYCKSTMASGLMTRPLWYPVDETLSLTATRTVPTVFITSELEEALFLADKIYIMGGQPARILDVIDIDLPRPRDFEVTVSKKYLEYKERAIKQLFQSEES